jgi:hypothetical protein
MCLVFGILCFVEEQKPGICENIPKTKH